jgi:hypothetical protein
VNVGEEQTAERRKTPVPYESTTKTTHNKRNHVHTVEYPKKRETVTSMGQNETPHGYVPQASM